MPIFKNLISSGNVCESPTCEGFLKHERWKTDESQTMAGALHHMVKLDSLNSGKDRPLPEV